VIYESRSLRRDTFGPDRHARSRAIVSSRLREGVIWWISATPSSSSSSSSSLSSSHGKVSILGSPPGKPQTFQFARILELRASRRAARFSIRVTFRRERVNGASTLCRSMIDRVDFYSTRDLTSRGASRGLLKTTELRRRTRSRLVPSSLPPTIFSHPFCFSRQGSQPPFIRVTSGDARNACTARSYVPSSCFLPSTGFISIAAKHARLLRASLCYFCFIECVATRYRLEQCERSADGERKESFEGR